MSSSPSSRPSSRQSSRQSSQEPPAQPAGDDGQAPRSAASRLFDIRLLIGALFLVYGVMLTVAGFFTSAAERAKAAGINMNLWLGLSMLVVGALFLLWMRLNPVAHAEADPARDSGDRGGR